MTTFSPMSPSERPGAVRLLLSILAVLLAGLLLAALVSWAFGQALRLELDQRRDWLQRRADYSFQRLNRELDALREQVRLLAAAPALRRAMTSTGVVVPLSLPGVVGSPLGGESAISGFAAVSPRYKAVRLVPGSPPLGGALALGMASAPGDVSLRQPSPADGGTPARGDRVVADSPPVGLSALARRDGESPAGPILTAVTPVFGDDGRILGELQADADFGPALEEMADLLPPGVGMLAIDEDGRVLLQVGPEPGREPEASRVLDTLREQGLLGSDAALWQRIASPSGALWFAASANRYGNAGREHRLTLVYWLREAAAEDAVMVRTHPLLPGVAAIVPLFLLLLLLPRQLSLRPLSGSNEVGKRDERPEAHPAGNEQGFANDSLEAISEDVWQQEREARRLDAQLEASLKSSERIIETTPEALLVVGPDGRIVRSNAHACEMFGFDLGDLPGLQVETLMPSRFRHGHERLRERFASETANRMMGRNRDLQGLRRDGSEFPVEVGLSPIRIGDDRYVLVSIADISERKRDDQEVLRLNAKLAELLKEQTAAAQASGEPLQPSTAELSAMRRLISEAERRKVEQERRRLSQELHDEIGQMLAAMSLNLEMVRRKCDSPGARVPLENAIQIADSVVQSIRDITHQLRPPQLDDFGLPAALRWHLERVRKTSFMRTRLTENLGSRRLPAEVELACFRIVQESITNVLRHASASSVAVEITLGPGRIRLCIVDNGVGFDLASGLMASDGRPHLGLIGMQDRVFGLNGSLEIVSGRRKGCTVIAEIPVSPIHPECGDDGSRADCR